MRKIILILLSTLLIASLAGCGGVENKYENNPNYYKVSYELGEGGMIDDIASNVVYHYYTAKDEGVKIATLEQLGVKFTSDGNSFLGWYKDAEYNESFNFDTDKITSDTVIYARWRKICSFEVYYVHEVEGEVVEQLVKDFIVADNSKYNKRNLPELDDKTLIGLYKDKDLNNPWDLDEDRHEGVYDSSTFTVENPVQKLYSKWLDGEWQLIYEPNDFNGLGAVDNVYLMNDIDFKGEHKMFLNSKYNGVFEGNGHTISNITLNNYVGESGLEYYGLFREIGDNAKFNNVTFENIIMTIEDDTSFGAKSVGLLAGSVSSKAKFSAVKLTGEIIFNNIKEKKANYGILSGSSLDSIEGIDIEDIVVTDNLDDYTIVTNGNEIKFEKILYINE